MFHLEEEAAGPRVYVRPKESIHIPLKYQSFLCDNTMALQVELGPEVDAYGTARKYSFITMKTMFDDLFRKHHNTCSPLEFFKFKFF